jgi:DNA-binding MarR family transcriptional regulator
MSTSDPFTQVLRTWAETFMHRSMIEFREFSRESGISMSQMSTLFHLHHCEACGVSEIADFLGFSNAAASQLVDRLYESGLLTRSEDPDDRRAKHVALTSKGLELVRESIEVRKRWMEQLTTELTDDEKQAITAALTLLTAAARKIEPELLNPRSLPHSTRDVAFPRREGG